MFKTVLKCSLMAGVLLASQACTSPAVTPPAANSINTIIAQTFAAAQTQTGQPGIPITGPTLTPTLAATSTMTLTSTSVFTETPAFTSTPSLIQVSVSVATNCRVGPGAAYAQVGGLLVDQVAEVVGRNSNNTYWIIRNPNRPGELCWLWGQFATVIGNPSVLPVFTPPPPPAPTATMTPTITRTPAPSATSPSTPVPSPTPTSTPTP